MGPSYRVGRARRRSHARAGAGHPRAPGARLAGLDHPARREALLRAIRRVEAEPALLGASPLSLAVGREPAERD
jgi:hypothetical protein